VRRRALLAALPLVGLAGPALAQQRPAPLPPLVDKPALPWTLVAEGLQFPEGPVVMKDGSLLFVEIARKTISRLTPQGRVEVVAEVPGGPNGLAVGPDGALWIANNGGRFSFAPRDGLLFPGGAPAGFTGGGSIQRMDLKTGRVATVFDSFAGKPLIAPDDLVFDRGGNLWITEIGLAPGTGAIYFLPKGGKALQLAKDGLNGPNGIGVSPDGRLLHISSQTSLLAFDIDGPGQLSTRTYPKGLQAPLYNGSYADSLKLQADGKVCVCSLIRPGGIGIVDRAGHTEFLGFPDRMVCNLAFGGRDLRDCWIMLSGLGKIAKVRWPSPGQAPAFRA
jgi:gluconolactonase